MSWLLIAFVSLSHFANGDDVLIEFPGKSQIVMEHNGHGYAYVGVHDSFVCPRSGMTTVETCRGGCLIALAWCETDVHLQWNPHSLDVDEDGQFYVNQKDCVIFYLWSFK